MHLLLPSSSRHLCVDRFSVLDDDSDTVPFWDILTAILSDNATSVSSIIDQLELIAVTLRGSTGTDFGFLRSFLSKWERLPQFLSNVWPRIVSLALEMPTLFPTGELASLTGENRTMSFSRRQVACLVIHQFLCSLPSQPWTTDSSPDFHIWYSSSQPHDRVVQAYLTALFTYFERLAGDLLSPRSEWPVTFSIHSLHGAGPLHDESLLGQEFSPLEVIRVSEASTAPYLLGLPRGAAVISANKNVGFGSSGTQEESHVGSSPEACPVVLLTPTLGPADVLVVQGAEAMISLIGYGRHARLDEILPTANTDAGSLVWTARTMLFMDALELDGHDPDGVLPDLLPGHLERELQKAYTAFSSSPYVSIFTGLWGCQSFGGNPQIKTIIQWCAASLAGVPLNFVCSSQQEEFAASLDFRWLPKECHWGQVQCWNCLAGIASFRS
ncbi:hypothetical protein ZTR_02318 [Talaromyces verruculosus]|nr:hypothetical protein ZTR_02318 [Talaromyces verruculosus]